MTQSIYEQPMDLLENYAATHRDELALAYPCQWLLIGVTTRACDNDGNQVADSEPVVLDNKPLARELARGRDYLHYLTYQYWTGSEDNCPEFVEAYARVSERQNEVEALDQDIQAFKTACDAGKLPISKWLTDIYQPEERERINNSSRIHLVMIGFCAGAFIMSLLVDNDMDFVFGEKDFYQWHCTK